jgi:CheY-like chemotaxis protein
MHEAARKPNRERSTQRLIAAPDSLLRGARIILAEDDPSVRRLTKSFLEELGCQVEAFANGLEALAVVLIDERPFALLLTDFDMPGLTGYELGQQLRVRWPKAKVLLTSGSPEESIVPSVKPDDWPPFIPKPFTSRSLGCRLREVLEDPLAAEETAVASQSAAR